MNSLVPLILLEESSTPQGAPDCKVTMELSCQPSQELCRRLNCRDIVGHRESETVALCRKRYCRSLICGNRLSCGKGILILKEEPSSE